MSASLILRTVKGVPLTNLEVDNNFSNLNIWTNTVDANVGVLSNLTTSSQDNIVSSVNEVVATASVINSNIGVLSDLTTAYKSNIVSSVNELNSGIGPLPDLLTTAKSNIVFSVNEVYTNVSNLSGNVGSLGSLSTTAKSSIVAAINEIASESTTNVTITGGSVANVTLSAIAVDDTSTAATYYPTFLTAASGNGNVKISSTKLTFTPSTGLLTSTDYNSTSDISLKEDITEIQNPLDIISKLNAFQFKWKDTGDVSYGFSAQDVEQVLPNIVKTRPDGIKGINYLNLIAFLTEAIKDLKQEIQELKSNK